MSDIACRRQEEIWRI